MTLSLLPSTISGSIQAPPSKSAAHRLLICAALAKGVSEIKNIDSSKDIQATIGALRQLGAVISLQDGTARVEGMEGGFATITRPVNCNESGSTLRFMIPIFSLTAQQVVFTGAPRLFERPLSVYQDIFKKQGLAFATSPTGLTTKGSLSPDEFYLPGDVSSQFITGLLFTLPLLEKDSVIHVESPFESRSYVELTISCLKQFGITCHWQGNSTLLIPGRQRYQCNSVEVEGDWSQAAVGAALGAVCGNVTIKGLRPDSTQGDRVIAQIVERCGAQLKWQDKQLTVVSQPENLVSPGEIDLSDCPDLGPVLCALAVFCKGTTKIVNAGRLRIKESDRIASVEQELKKLGAKISSTQDSITIEGGYPLLSGQTTQSHNDHRVVMALSVAALGGGLSLDIEGTGAVSKSWPAFFKDLQGLGAEVRGFV